MLISRWCQNFNLKLFNFHNIFWSDYFYSDATCYIKKMWVFFTGYGQSGKGVAADWLVNNHGYYKLSFADGVRDKAVEENRYFPSLNGTYTEVIDRLGYNEAKQYQCIRDYLVEIGEGSRQKYGLFIWIDMLDEKVKAKMENGNKDLLLTVDDCRYTNEVLYGKKRGNCLLIRIKRKNCKAKHETEKKTIKELTPDYTIENNGTIEEFLTKLESIIFCTNQK